MIGTANPYRKYYGAMMVLQKVMSHRWSGQISYVWSRTTGTVNNNCTENQQGAQFQTPNLALVNVDGHAINDRTHEFKTYAELSDTENRGVAERVLPVPQRPDYNPVQRLAGSVINYSARSTSMWSRWGAGATTA